ncbi:hypothetical protein [Comamonas sp. wu1-DMT]|uniref:hypothetical protein n=1 Tax=Comamonas sp. wu1-DMT TaxID=3126390 RepID=UPI0032E40284
MNAEELIEGVGKAAVGGDPSQVYCLFAIEHWSTCMTKAEWAGWMQAIFSVLAIAAAACIAAFQASRASKDVAAREAKEALAKRAAIKATLRRVRVAVDNAERVLKVNDGSEQTAWQHVEQVRVILRSISPFEVPDADLVFLVHRTDRDLDYVFEMLKTRITPEPGRERTRGEPLFKRIRVRLDEAITACDQSG